LSVASAFLVDMSKGEDAARTRPRWLLWDLENCPPARGQARLMLSRLIEVAGPVALVVAATAESSALARYRAELKGLGVVFIPAFTGPHGAELALLSYVARCPASEMVVVSDDGQFVALTRGGHRIVVLSRRPHLVAKRLAEIAVVVLQVSVPPSTTRPRAPQRPGQTTVPPAPRPRRRKGKTYTDDLRRSMRHRRRQQRQADDLRSWREEIQRGPDEDAPASP
jgi:hypothetical protein